MSLNKKNTTSKDSHHENDIHVNGNGALNALVKLQVPEGKTKQQAWNDLVIKIQSAERTAPVISIKPKRYSLIAIAASFVLLIGVGFSILSYTTRVSIVCPAGQQMTVRLPDQSSVTLNSETKLSYNKILWKTKRTVFLNGEAFFNVQKGKTFDVKTSEAQVSVLGTSFNVFARKGEVKVNCFTGKVAVKNRIKMLKTVILVPGKETILSSDGQPSDPSSFDILKTACWKNGEFYFSQDPILKVIDELERQYKVQVDFKGDTNRIYTGYFTNRNLSEALNLICMPMNLKYNLKNNKIIISQ